MQPVFPTLKGQGCPCWGVDLCPLSEWLPQNLLPNLSHHHHSKTRAILGQGKGHSEEMQEPPGPIDLSEANLHYEEQNKFFLAKIYEPSDKGTKIKS